MWTRETLAWAAGIFEGEGSCSAVRERETAVRLQITVAMTDEDVLRTLHRTLGVGNLTGPYDRSRHGCRKPQYVYTVTNREAYAALVALWPWLHARRREQVSSAVSAWLEAHRLRADPVRRFAAMVASTDAGCLVWLGHLTATGAGAFHVREHRKQQAHRFLYEHEHPVGVAPYMRKACSTVACIRHWTPIGVAA